MQVYSVIAGCDYEGENVSTLKLFDCKSSAIEYKEYLQDQFGIDYVIMQLQNVIMDSAIVKTLAFV